MFCKKCGAEIKSNGRFCPKCGQEVKTVENMISDTQIEKEINVEEIPVSMQNASEAPGKQEPAFSDQNLAPVMSVWSYLGLFLLASIPIVGIIIIIVFAINSNNQNKTNYCRAIILGQIILFLIAIMFSSSLMGIFASLLYSL